MEKNVSRKASMDTSTAGATGGVINRIAPPAESGTPASGKGCHLCCVRQ